MIRKIACRYKKKQIISYHSHEKGEGQNYFSDKVLELEHCDSIGNAQLFSMIRKNIASDKSSFIDLRLTNGNEHELIQLIEFIKQGFLNVKICLSISAIHSENYNYKFINKFENFVDILNVTFLDKCLDYGHLFNLNYMFKEIGFGVFSNGETVPTDIEEASSERILGSIFKI